jgi:hypothetical protein
VNLSTVTDFSEFVEQVRVDKHSQVVLMPHYRQALNWRQLQSFAEILKFYPEFEADRQKWFARVHVKVDERGVVPLSTFWDRGGPLWLRMATWTLGAFGSPAARPVFSLVVKNKDRVPKTFKSQIVLPVAETDSEAISTTFSSDTA